MNEVLLKDAEFQKLIARIREDEKIMKAALKERHENMILEFWLRRGMNLKPGINPVASLNEKEVIDQTHVVTETNPFFSEVENENVVFDVNFDLLAINPLSPILVNTEKTTTTQKKRTRKRATRKKKLDDDDEYNDSSYVEEKEEDIDVSYSLDDEEKEEIELLKREAGIFKERPVATNTDFNGQYSDNDFNDDENDSGENIERDDEAGGVVQQQDCYGLKLFLSTMNISGYEAAIKTNWFRTRFSDRIKGVKSNMGNENHDAAALFETVALKSFDADSAITLKQYSVNWNEICTFCGMKKHCVHNLIIDGKSHAIGNKCIDLAVGVIDFFGYLNELSLVSKKGQIDILDLKLEVLAIEKKMTAMLIGNASKKKKKMKEIFISE